MSFFLSYIQVICHIELFHIQTLLVTPTGLPRANEIPLNICKPFAQRYNKYNVSLEDACDECLQRMRDCLDEGLDDVEED